MIRSISSSRPNNCVIIICSQVTRAAEECITLMARIVPPSRCHVFLKPLIECEDFPVNLAAIKMFTQVIEEHQKDDVIALLPDMVPGLLKVDISNAQSCNIL